MNNRLQQIIKYKAGGRQNVFAELMGWQTPYLNKLVKGVNFGLQPVLAILDKFPDIDARWFLLGEGEMLSERKYTDVLNGSHSFILSILELEKYLLVMTPEEVSHFESICTGRAMPNYTPEQIGDWQFKLDARNNFINQKIQEAQCKAQIVKQ